MPRREGDWEGSAAVRLVVLWLGGSLGLAGD
jgi:hypothetical protein